MRDQTVPACLNGFVAIDGSRVLTKVAKSKDKGLLTACNLACANGQALLSVSSRDILRAPSMLLLPAQVPLTSTEVERVLARVRSGATLTILAGFEEAVSVEVLFKALGIEATNIPLGAAHEARIAPTCPVEAARHIGGQVRFLRSWALRPKSSDWAVWITCWGHPLVVRRQLGKGSVTIIGDPSFLEPLNLAADDNSLKPAGRLLQMVIRP